MSQESIDVLVSQRPNYYAAIAETATSEQVRFTNEYESFVDALIFYLEQVEARLQAGNL